MPKLVQRNHIFKIPSDIAVCPYRQSPLYASVNGWIKQSDGWIADSFDIECETEPGLDEPKWIEWYYTHSYLFFYSARTSN